MLGPEFCMLVGTGEEGEEEEEQVKVKGGSPKEPPAASAAGTGSCHAEAGEEKARDGGHFAWAHQTEMRLLFPYRNCSSLMFCCAILNAYLRMVKNRAICAV